MSTLLDRRRTAIAKVDDPRVILNLHNIDFNGTTDYINTGIKLYGGLYYDCDWDLDFTFTFSDWQATNSAFLSTKKEGTSPYPGFTFCVSNANRIQSSHGGTPSKTVTLSGGINQQCRFYLIKRGTTYTLTIENEQSSTTETYTTSIPLLLVPLTLGCELNSNAVPYRFKSFHLNKLRLKLKELPQTFPDDPQYIVNYNSNPDFMYTMYQSGLSPRLQGMTAAECAAVTDSDFAQFAYGSFSADYCDEFQYFTGITKRQSNYPFSVYLKRITFPPGFATSALDVMNGADIEQLTLLAGSKYYGTAGSPSRIRTLRVLGDITTYGYSNTAGYNSFKNIFIDSMQLCGKMSNNYAFADTAMNSTLGLNYGLVVELINSSGDVVTQNTNYKSINGNIYTADGSTLCFHKREITTQVDIDSNATEIDGGCLCQIENITEMVIPSNITTIHNGAICRCPNLETVRFMGSATTLYYLKSDPTYGSEMATISRCDKLKRIINAPVHSGPEFYRTSIAYECPLLEVVSFCPSFTRVIKSSLMYNYDTLRKVSFTYTGGVVTLVADAKTGFEGGTFDIYVPDALVNDYKIHSDYANMVSRIKPNSDFTET